MSQWYYKITRDLSQISNFVQHFENEYQQARLQLSLKGKTIEKHSAELPGIVEERYAQLQEIEAVLEYLNIELRKTRSKVFKKFLENYQRELSSRDCEKYVDGDSEVVDMTLIVNEVALLRNKFLSISKGLDQKGWMISHVVKLRTAGLEDASI